MVLESRRRACGGACAVLLEGEAGVGKTALWRCGVQDARADGWRILHSAPTGSESRLGFAALGDLLDRDWDELAPALARPQRIALERALLRRGAPTGTTLVDERTIGVATLSCLRILAAQGPVVVAIDDLHWVDAASAAVLRFALRRLTDEPILVLAARRLPHLPRSTTELDRLLSDERVVRVRVAPLTVAAIHDLLATRLDFHPPRPVLLRLYELSGGNAFFALEIARELVRQGAAPGASDALPVPGSVRELIHARFARLSRPTLRVLLATAALARPTRDLLAGVDAEADTALAQARDAGVIELVPGERVRFTHPLFASVLYEQAPLADRRRVHARLSGLIEDLEERARHLALATVGVDDAVAAQLDGAIVCAGARGAPQAAAELSDLAARLTADPSKRAERVLASCEHHRAAGNLGLATDRAREVLDTAHGPGLRARALVVLGTIATDSEGVAAGLPYFRRAVREPGAPRSLRCDVHHKLAWLSLVSADARRAEGHAYAMMRLADEDDPAAVAAAAATLSHAVVARGRPVPRELLARALRLEAGVRSTQPWVWSETGPAVLEGVVLLWGGELEEARVALERLLAEAEERGHLWVEMMALAYLSSVQTGLGRPREGLALAERYLELAVMVGQEAHRAGALWPLAVAAGWLGDGARATEAAEEGLALARRTGHTLYVIGHLTALGAVQLSLGAPDAAAVTLLEAHAVADAGGIASPARFPLLANAVEALVLCGELERARPLVAEHDAIARALGRPWVLALAARCAALLAAGDGEDQVAQEAFEAALRQHAQQPRPLDLARTLLAAGAAHRRARRKSAAREALTQAADIFAQAGAEQWSRRARSEMARIGGRSGPGAGELSATETEIADRVADGLTNREIAEALHLSARTVEWNLSRVYRKLGVRSRTELAVAIGGRAERRTPGVEE